MRPVHMAPYHSPFDLLVRSFKVEVKCAKPIKGEWKFNIHRHNKVKESNVDFYILRLDKFPYSKKAMHLVLKAPLRKPTVTVTIRSLLEKYHGQCNQVDVFSS